MKMTVNALPVDVYVRTRKQTIVSDVGNLSSGSIALNLEKPSDVTIINACTGATSQPALFVAAIDRQPTLADFDIVFSPTSLLIISTPNKVTICLPAGSHTLYWKSMDIDSTASPFPSLASRLVLAVDQ